MEAQGGSGPVQHRILVTSTDCYRGHGGSVFGRRLLAAMTRAGSDRPRPAICPLYTVTCPRCTVWT
jgi:hypothetical protein